MKKEFRYLTMMEMLNSIILAGLIKKIEQKVYKAGSLFKMNYVKTSTIIFKPPPNSELKRGNCS